MVISRRRAMTVLAGGAVVAGGGAAAAWRGLAPTYGPGPDAVPTATPGPLSRGTFASRACGRQVAWQLALPPGASEGEGLPVALVLHGRGGDAAAAFDQLHLDGFLADVVAAGSTPFALASVADGDHAYWHRRASGEDPQAMLLEEYLPLLASQRLLTDRIGAFGWSMGGYGALLLAQTTGPQRVAAVAASSPALWSCARDTADGAFDDAEDFAAHDVVGHPERLAGVPVCRCAWRAGTTTRSLPSRTPSRRRSLTWPARTSALAGTPAATGAHRPPPSCASSVGHWPAPDAATCVLTGRLWGA